MAIIFQDSLTAISHRLSQPNHLNHQNSKAVSLVRCPLEDSFREAGHPYWWTTTWICWTLWLLSARMQTVEVADVKLW